MPFKNQHSLYSTWRSMRDRCMNPNTRYWNNYGGRGINICERWNSFQAFAADMGPKPQGYSLDRIDNDGGYFPTNCRWATRKEQQLNRRCAVYVEVEGQKYRAIELAERAGVKTDTIIGRAARGLSMEQVLDPKPSHNISGLALGGVANGRRQRSKTHCPHGHAYAPDNIVASKLGYRKCKTCHRERAGRTRANKLSP